MTDIQTAHIVFFSGTGGTARMADCLRQAFVARGVEVAKTELTNKANPMVQADLLVLLYPVYAANAPQPIGEWIAATAHGNGTPAVVVAVSGGGEVSPNTACRVATNRALEAKGYPVVYEAMAVMPSNFLEGYSDALSALILRKAPLLAARIAEDVLSAKTKRIRPLARDRVFSRLFMLEHLGSRLFGKHLKASESCTGCGWCADHCPRGNITLTHGQPVFGDRCVLCTRCLYGCPTKAITPQFGKFAVLKQGFDLDAVEARTQGNVEFPPVEELMKGFGYGGVRKYLVDE